MLLKISAVFLLVLIAECACSGDNAAQNANETNEARAKRYRAIDELSGSHIFAKRERSPNADDGAEGQGMAMDAEMQKRGRFREIDELSGLGIYKKSAQGQVPEASESSEAVLEADKRALAFRWHLVPPSRAKMLRAKSKAAP